MLSGDGNENKKRKTIGLISKKLHCTCSTLFQCTFLCLRFARLQRQPSRKFLVTHFMEEISYVFVFAFFHCPSFSPWWTLAFLIFSPML